MDRCGGDSCGIVTDAMRVPLGQGAYVNSIKDPLCMFIDNESQWCEFWDHVGWSACDTTLIDFHREVAVVLALGNKPDTCHTVSIEKICRQGSMGAELNVLGIETTFPVDENCGCFTAIVQPLDVVRIKRPVSAVTCYTRAEPATCGP